MSQKPSKGQVVHVVLGMKEDGRPVIRPGIIVEAWDDETINAQVFTDGSNDNSVLPENEKVGRDGKSTRQARYIVWRTSIHYSEEPRANTWHWMPWTQDTPDLP